MHPRQHIRIIPRQVPVHQHASVVLVPHKHAALCVHIPLRRRLFFRSDPVIHPFHLRSFRRVPAVSYATFPERAHHNAPWHPSTSETVRTSAGISPDNTDCTCRAAGRHHAQQRIPGSYPSAAEQSLSRLSRPNCITPVLFEGSAPAPSRRGAFRRLFRSVTYFFQAEKIGKTRCLFSVSRFSCAAVTCSCKLQTIHGDGNNAYRLVDPQGLEPWTDRL